MQAITGVCWGTNALALVVRGLGSHKVAHVNDNLGDGRSPVTLGDGTTVNTATGPYNLQGFRPMSRTQLTDPLVFFTAGQPGPVG